MKLYNSVGPNPRVVNMFLAEKGVEIDRVQVDIMAGENRQDAHLARNPAGQAPTLELDDGTFIAEITAICEYLDELYPEPPLIGSTPQERAVTRMWARRIDLQVVEPMLIGFRSSEGFAMFKDRVRLLPQVVYANVSGIASVSGTAGAAAASGAFIVVACHQWRSDSDDGAGEESAPEGDGGRCASCGGGVGAGKEVAHPGFRARCGGGCESIARVCAALGWPDAADLARQDRGGDRRRS